MNLTDIITIIFSSTVLTTVITAIFNLFINKNKDSIENITKERKTWRDEMRGIAVSIRKSKTPEELLDASAELKVRINAYGMLRKFISEQQFLFDSHIWKQILQKDLNDETFCDNNLENTKEYLVNAISCLLKYDWERSKSEIKGNVQLRSVIFSFATSLLMYSVRWFYFYQLGAGKVIDYLAYLVCFVFIFAVAVFMINKSDKWKLPALRFSIWKIFWLGVVTIVFMYVILYVSVPSAFPSDLTEWIIAAAPFMTFVIALIFKLYTYRENVGLFIATSAEICKNKIPKQYKGIFILKYAKYYK